jgi:hypothetical protein
MPGSVDLAATKGGKRQSSIHLIGLVWESSAHYQGFCEYLDNIPDLGRKSEEFVTNNLAFLSLFFKAGEILPKCFMGQDPGSRSTRSLKLEPLLAGIAAQLEQFHNSRALCCTAKGAFFSRKKTLESGGSGVQQLWNRCSPGPVRQPGSRAGSPRKGIDGDYCGSCSRALFQARAS